MLEFKANQTWDRFEFSYSVLDNDADKELELPFKLLVLGNFSQSNELRAPDELKPVAIDASSFDQILAAQNIGFSFEIAQSLGSNALCYMEIDVQINAMEDFHPRQLVLKVPYLAAMAQLMSRLQELQETSEVTLEQFSPEHFSPEFFSQEQQQLLGQFGVTEAINQAELPFICSDLNEHLHQMLDLILHNEQFQQLEAIWRNLLRLVNSAGDSQDCHIEFLDISQQELMEDFEANQDIRESLLFDIVYFREFAQYGGQPYTAMVGDYEFGKGVEDIQLLRSIAQVAHAAHAPFIGGINPGFFNLDDFATDISDPVGMVTGPRYIKWRGLQQEILASYIGLALPRIQLRSGYNFGAGVLGLLPYVENTRLCTSKVLMGNASFAFAQCLISSFRKFRICTQIAGPEGGLVTGLQNTDSHKGYADFPLEAVFSEQKVAQLSSLGLLPLSVNKATQQLMFSSASSIRWGSMSKVSMRPDESVLDSQVEAQLPYLFVISRLAHYLKVVQRESIGSMKNASELQNELNRWLRRYVSDAENPAPGVRTRKPLKKAQVVVQQDPLTGDYEMRLDVVPHMKFMGNDFALALNVLAD